MAPAGTPANIVTRLNTKISKALADPATRDKLLALGITPRGMPAAEFSRALKAQFELYRKLIEERGIKIE